MWDTYSLAFLPSQNAMFPYTIGTLISTSLSFLPKFYTKPRNGYSYTINKKNVEEFIFLFFMTFWNIFSVLYIDFEVIATLNDSSNSKLPFWTPNWIKLQALYTPKKKVGFGGSIGLVIWKMGIYPNLNGNKDTFLSLSSDLPILVRWDLGVGPLNWGWSGPCFFEDELLLISIYEFVS